MTKITFPSAPLGEMTIFRYDNPTGMFGYKSNQVRTLMSPPDYCGGDLISDAAWRRRALNESIVLYKPLTAVILFLQVVALEDYIRSMNESLPNVKGLDSYFPNIGKLKAELKTPKSVGKPKDNDTVKPLQFKELNKVYSELFGIGPISSSEHAKLYDLALIRHTVAHHGSIIRPIDVSRFQYYEVYANQHINPPVEFLTETIKYLQDIQKKFSNTLESVIFSTILAKIGKEELLKRPKLLRDLLGIFDYFGFIDDLLLNKAFEELERRHF